ncbi:recombinase family protein [Leptothoe sp. PORK10 BA2]|uniref:recombinase family protein n=1 Tax=Leptothoe sp. PORK10 BA2 TaxID=3110254 RepID=UPI002B208A99|nr:recombinase family protein [Leptothoe sp. PORK10 BA2]MEA5467224.1 recombinase family protein [Leptothoe sp. PORK10 BA2]
MHQSKIQPVHLNRKAYVYLRQSTMGQVRLNRESTERQYALKERALALGWSESLIEVLDGDLGLSGAESTARKDFQLLVSDVSMGKVGAILALEASRLSRSSADWSRLVELCAFSGVLIIDEDGCYDPSDFNDQLLLGLKGTMSQAELHFIRSRLAGGKQNKAKKGELRFPLPIGYCYDDFGQIVFDHDEQVREVIELFFQVFANKRSAYGVTRYFGEQQIDFPKRAYGGIWNGKIIWGKLTYGRAITLLKNPSYTGAYVYGRYKVEKSLSVDGTLSSRLKLQPRDKWEVIIQDHHSSYISWQTYLTNQDILQKNQTNGAGTVVTSAAREGKALLHGLLICSKCGRRLTVRYTGNGGLWPQYECNWRKKEGLTGRSCLNTRADIVDNAIIPLIFEALEPQQLEIALMSLDKIEAHYAKVDKQWQLTLERADYEAQIAQRRFEEVDPANRLVAATLENRWEQALLKVQQIKEARLQQRQTQPLNQMSETDKADLLRLAEHLPQLWNAEQTQSKPKKQIIRLLVEDVTVERLAQPRQLVLHIRWKGGKLESLTIPIPLKQADRVRYPDKTIHKIRELAKTLHDRNIADTLNQLDIKSSSGKPFTSSMVKWLRYKHDIPVCPTHRQGELTVKQVAQQYGVSTHIVYYWLETGILQAQKSHCGTYQIVISESKHQELTAWAQVPRTEKIRQARLGQSQR